MNRWANILKRSLTAMLDAKDRAFEALCDPRPGNGFPDITWEYLHNQNGVKVLCSCGARLFLKGELHYHNIYNFAMTHICKTKRKAKR